MCVSRENSIKPKILRNLGIKGQKNFKFTVVQFMIEKNRRMYLGDKMGRKKGLDKKKIGAIISVLVSNPEGLWLRQIAKDTNLSPATVSHYIDTVLRPLTEDASLGKGSKPLLRVIKLKPFVLEKLEEGRDINQIMKILDLMKKIS